MSSKFHNTTTAMKKIAFFFSLALASFQMTAQRGNPNSSMELGGSIGFSTYMGDLSKSPYGDFQASDLSLGAFFRYNFSERFALRLHADLMNVHGDDAVTGDANRNLSFRSSIYEFGGMLEFNILPLIPDEGKRIAPYVFAGISMFGFNPEAKDSRGNWVALAPLGTEGQYPNTTPTASDPYPYGTTSIAIPMGAGVRYALTDNLLVGLEVGFRYTGTDYLDDVSTVYPNFTRLSADARAFSNRTPADQVQPLPGAARGDANTNDFYLNTSVTLSYRFSGLGGGGRMGCPTF